MRAPSSQRTLEGSWYRKRGTVRCQSGLAVGFESKLEHIPSDAHGSLIRAFLNDH